MIVVSDTSPINNLAAINQLDLLRQLYDTVVIPEAVYRELTAPTFPVAGGTEVKTESWILIRQVNNRALVVAFQDELDIGEAEALALALELDAEQILIDERRGRMIAARLNLIEIYGNFRDFNRSKKSGINSFSQTVVRRSDYLCGFLD